MAYIQLKTNNQALQITCRPKRYQQEPTTWPASMKIRRLITKFAHADSKINPLADWPMTKGTKRTIRGIYCKRTVARKRFFA